MKKIEEHIRRYVYICVGGWVGTILNRVVKLGVMEKVTCEHSLEGGEVGYSDILGEYCF